jgi:hypothetical protein
LELLQDLAGVVQEVAAFLRRLVQHGGASCAALGDMPLDVQVGLRCRLLAGGRRVDVCPKLLCCAVLCCAVLCCAVLCCAVLCCAVLCCAGPCLLVVSSSSGCAARPSMYHAAMHVDCCNQAVVVHRLQCTPYARWR